MSSGPRFDRRDALQVAAQLASALRCVTKPDRLKVVGSLRRRKPDVGDIEILFIPRSEGRSVVAEADLFGAKSDVQMVDLAAERLDELVASGVISRRLGPGGKLAWGTANKFAVHNESGIPVDFFAAQESSWWNLVVCRTGSARSNTEIALAAERKGRRWNPYGAGFYDRDDPTRLLRAVGSEEECFAAVGLPYREPWRRF